MNYNKILAKFLTIVITIIAQQYNCGPSIFAVGELSNSAVNNQPEKDIETLEEEEEHEDEDEEEEETDVIGNYDLRAFMVGSSFVDSQEKFIYCNWL